MKSSSPSSAMIPPRGSPPGMPRTRRTGGRTGGAPVTPTPPTSAYGTPPPSSSISSSMTSSSTSGGGGGGGAIDKQPAFRRATTFEAALSCVRVPPTLFDGIPVIKVSSTGRMHQRILTLSQNRFTLFVTPMGKESGGGGGVAKPILRKVASIGSSSAGSDYAPGEAGDSSEQRAIDVGSIDRIQRGQNTLKFELARNRTGGTKRSVSGTVSTGMGSSAGASGGVQGGRPVSHASFVSSSSSTLPPNMHALDPDRSFSIIFRGERTLDLMVRTDQRDRDEILDGLDAIVAAYRQSKCRATNDVLLMRYIWLDVDKDKSNTIDVGELHKLLHRINLHMSRKKLDESYKKFANVLALDKAARKRGLTFDQCVTFLHKIKRDTWERKPVQALWTDLVGAERTISAPRFLKMFLHEIQGERDVTLSYVRHLFRELNQLEIAKVSNMDRDPTKYIDKHRFEVYLSSEVNDAYRPPKQKFQRDAMNMPLSHYWINSSHNTYLTGDQIKSLSSVEMYMAALYRGCRCVEIDVWDGETDVLSAGTKPIPVVYHGHTMTSKIPFAETIRAIKVFLNFHPDSYPIILSLENHCSLPYQRAMADILVDVLGPSLYVPTERVLSGQLPSPESLKGMVVIKGRRPTDEFGDVSDCDDSDDEGMEEGVEVSAAQHLLSGGSSDAALPLRPVGGSRTNGGGGGSSGNNAAASSKNVKIAPQLARLTLLHGTRFKKWDESIDNPTYHMHSFSESQISRIYNRRQGNHCVIYNRHHLSRSYPAGWRAGSSNYSPVLAWSMGCQLAALNFQTAGPPMWINDGFFRQNGNCGYVPKSRELVDNSYSGERGVDLSLTLTVRVLSGSCLPKPKGHKRGECIDPYVRVSAYDVYENEGREVSQSYVTNTVKDNGFSPIWNPVDFRFDVQNESVAMLLFTVLDSDVGKNDDFIASAAIPVSCLRKGYRNVRLYDANNTRSGAFDFASLLIKVDMEVIV